MALPTNIFKTNVGVVGFSPATIYTAPVGYVGVILLAQVANIGTSTQTINFYHSRTVSGAAVTTELLYGYPLENNDTSSLLSGKLALQSGDSISISGSSDADLKYVVSLLETLSN
jgi:hypothetical protein